MGAPGEKDGSRDACRPDGFGCGGRALSRRSALGLALAAAAGLAGCSSASGGDVGSPSEPLNPSEGKLGGKLVLYTSCSESLINAVVPRFSSELGVAVDVVRGDTASCLERVRDEVASGNPVADVVWGGDPSWYGVAAQTAGEAAASGDGAGTSGCFLSYVSPEDGSARDGCRNLGGFCTPVTREVAVIAAASSAVLPFDPSGYESLSGHLAGGGLAIEDPRSSSVALAHLAGIASASAVLAGPSDDSVADGASTGVSAPNDAAVRYLAELRSGVAEVSGDELGDGEAVVRELVEGRDVLGLASEQACLAEVRDGNDLEVVYPEEGAAVTLGCTAIVRGCPSQTQAQAWVDFVTGETCQRALAEDALARPVRSGIEDPAELPEVGEPLTPDAEALLVLWDAAALEADASEG